MSGSEANHLGNEASDFWQCASDVWHFRSKDSMVRYWNLTVGPNPLKIGDGGCLIRVAKSRRASDSRLMYEVS